MTSKLDKRIFIKKISQLADMMRNEHHLFLFLSPGDSASGLDAKSKGAPGTADE